VGVAAIQWAKNAGLKVVGTASSPEGLTLAKDHGCDAVFDHSDADHLSDIREYTEGRGVDLIIEMLANVNLERDFACLAMFGRIVVVGNRGSLEFTPRLAMGKDATIYGMSMFNAPTGAMSDIQEAIFTGLTKGFLTPVVRESIPLADAARSHRQVIENKAFGKIVLTP